MDTRRFFLVASATTLFPSLALAARDDDCDGRGKIIADDPHAATSRDHDEILSLHQGATDPSQIATAISSNFQLIIEQNFRRMKPVELRLLLSQLSDAEINDLAFLYNRSALNSGRTAKLLDIVASKADSQSLQRVADHFGFADVYAAVYRAVPNDAHSLTQKLHTAQQRAVGLLFKTGVPRNAKGVTPTPSTVPLNVDATLGEIYSSFRTAPAGALSVQGALYETAAFAGTRLVGAYTFGYAIGSGIDSLWSTYSPGTYAQSSQWLGSTVDGFVNSVQNILNGNTLESVSQYLRSAVGSLESIFFNAMNPGGPRASYYTNGGDYRVSSPWGDNERMSCK